MYGESSKHWRKFEELDFFRIKGEIVQLLQSININNISFKMKQVRGYKNSMKIYCKKIDIGTFGILEDDLLEAYDINVNPIICDISLPGDIPNIAQ